MTATELYKHREQQTIDAIDYYNIQTEASEKYIYHGYPDLIEYIDSFISECQDIGAMLDTGECFELDENRNETLNQCIKNITERYFYVLKTRKEFKTDHKII